MLLCFQWASITPMARDAVFMFRHCREMVSPLVVHAQPRLGTDQMWTQVVSWNVISPCCKHIFFPNYLLVWEKYTIKYIQKDVSLINHIFFPVEKEKTQKPMLYDCLRTYFYVNVHCSSKQIVFMTAVSYCLVNHLLLWILNYCL